MTIRDLMVSDTMPGKGAPPQGNVSVCLSSDDPVEMAKKFGALAVGEKVEYPLRDAFWGGTFRRAHRRHPWAV